MKIIVVVTAAATTTVIKLCLREADFCIMPSVVAFNVKVVRWAHFYSTHRTN